MASVSVVLKALSQGQIGLNSAHNGVWLQQKHDDEVMICVQRLRAVLSNEIKLMCCFNDPVLQQRSSEAIIYPENGFAYSIQF